MHTAIAPLFPPKRYAPVHLFYCTRELHPINRGGKDDSAGGSIPFFLAVRKLYWAARFTLIIPAVAVQSLASRPAV